MNNCNYTKLSSIRPKIRQKKIILESAYTLPIQTTINDMKELIEYKINEKALLDIFDQRIKLMNIYNIEISIISLTSPGLENMKKQYIKNSVEIAKYINNTIYQLSYPYKNRIKVFAVLPMLNPLEASKELERCIKKLNFVGALVNLSTTYYVNDKPYQESYTNIKYDILWKKFIELNVPIYFHPKTLQSQYLFENDDFLKILSSSPWGFSIDTGLLILKLMMTGLFDRNPTLKVIIGHMGEFLPIYLDRVDHRICIYKNSLHKINQNIQKNSKEYKLYIQNYHKLPKKSMNYYLNNNIYITTSGFFEFKTYKYLNKKHLLFSIDYPYESVASASNWIDNSNIPLNIKKDICYNNAERIFNFK